MKFLPILVILLTAIFSIGCGHSNIQRSDLEDKSCYPNPLHQLLFAYGLNNEKIMYRSDGTGCFYTKYNDQEKIEHIQEIVFGKAPPLSLRVYRGKNSNTKLVKSLDKHGVKTYRIVFFGDDYIAWKEKDAVKVDSFLDRIPGQFNRAQNMAKH